MHKEVLVEEQVEQDITLVCSSTDQNSEKEGQFWASKNPIPTWEIVRLPELWSYLLVNWTA